VRPGRLAARRRGGVGERHDQLRGAHRAPSPAAAARSRPPIAVAGLVPRRRGLPHVGGHAGTHGLRTERAAGGGRDGAAGGSVLPRAASPHPPPRPHVSLLDAREVSFAYGSRVVLDGIDLAVDPGEIVGLIGPNGSGKSTLVRLLAGLVRPRAGTVSLAGRPIAGWSRVELARQLAL